MRLLRPDEWRRSIFAVDLDKLKDRGIKVLMVDLDNTLVPWNDPDPTEQLQVWLAEARHRGFEICIVSNNTGRRVSDFARRLGIHFVPSAMKPRRKGFQLAMAMLGARPEETAVIGDQIFTDVLGGNRAGAYTILVVPMRQQEFFFTRRFTRPVERVVLRYLHNRGLKIEE